MPTLDWIGKKAVLNHHREVAYRLLRCNAELSAGDPDSGNLLVQGDNLLALKALLPYYAGKVKCIYIDPPYNTGNEKWVYNDAVNSPEMRDWLGKVVGGEDEDLSRHDKWLCMLYPRLSLLNEFLTQDGVIFVSIDDFEAHRLRSIVDEIFGPRNFIAQLVWDKTRKNDAKLFSVGHEYVLVYAKSLRRLRDLKTVWREQKLGAREVIAEWQRLKAQLGENHEAIQDALRQWYKALPKTNPAKKLSRHKWVDKFGPWRDRDISWPGGGGPRYDVLHPRTGLPCRVPERGWGFATSEAMEKQIRMGLVQFRDDHTEPPFRKAHLLPIPDELSDDEEFGTEEEDDCDQGAGLQVMPSVIQKQAQVVAKLLRRIFGGQRVFPNAKDHEIIMRLIRYVTGPEDLVLDSFSGSGTTGHAVLQLNKEDSSHRKFILVELDESIARDITSERLRRVVSGYLDDTGLGGGFRYCTLGEPLFNEAGNIREHVKFPELAAHIFFTETGSPIPKQASGKTPFLGEHNGNAVYLLFNGVLGDKSVKGGNVLTSEVLRHLPLHAGTKVVYGEGCRLGAARLKREGVVFKQVPYEIKVS